jgi:hypothetical protein
VAWAGTVTVLKDGSRVDERGMPIMPVCKETKYGSVQCPMTIEQKKYLIEKYNPVLAVCPDESGKLFLCAVPSSDTKAMDYTILVPDLGKFE